MGKFDSFKLWTKNHSSSILFGLGCASFVSTIIFTAKEAPEAKERLTALKETEEYQEKSKPKKMLAVCRVAGPVYVPAIISGAVSITCFSTSHKMTTKENAAWAAGYAVLDRKFRDYREENLKLIGPKKEQAVRDEVNKKAVGENPPTEENTFYLADGSGTQLFYDRGSGRYFMSTRDEIWKVVNNLTKRKTIEMWVALNELYSDLGLPPILLGDYNGWDADTDIDISLDTCVMAPDGRSCVVMDYDIVPRSRY